MTKAELRNHILRQLGVIGAVDVPTAEDATLMETIIDNCQDELEHMEVATWGADDVPGFAIESFCHYVKSSCTAWGQAYDPNLKALALRQLRYVSADKRAGTGKACYF